MPLLFFRLVDGPFAFDDIEGERYEDVETARAGAVVFLSNMLLARREQIRVGKEWRILVKDERGASVIELVFAVR